MGHEGPSTATTTGGCRLRVKCSRLLRARSTRVPIFFFDIYDGRTDLDADGTDLDDIYVAQAEATRMSGAILRDMGARFWDVRAWRLEVSDADRRLLFRLHFTAEEHPFSASGDNSD